MVSEVRVTPLNVGLLVVRRFWLRLLLPVRVKVFPPPLTVRSPPVTVSVLLVVPPATENPSALAVRLRPLTVLLVRASAPASVARVPEVGRVTLVIPVVV